MTRRRAVLAAAAAVLAALMIALLIALLPVTVVALGSVAAAWHNGWPPARLYRAAAWCLPMLLVWLAGSAITGHWPAAGDLLTVRAVVLTVPVVIPAGLLAGGWAWQLRRISMAARAGGRSPAAAVSFDLRQWRHQVRSARARIAGPVPLLTARGDVIAGAVIRAVGHPYRDLTVLPAARLRMHQLVIGATGTGKTSLLLRLWAAFMASGLAWHAAGRAGPPLVVVLDCKGGADARRIADRFRRVLRQSGARNVAVWPDEARLCLWDLPARQLITTLVDLVEHGTGGAAYYTDVMEAVVALAVEAPAGPPVSTADFLARLDPGWLMQAYPAEPLVRSAASQVTNIALRFRTLFRRLGPGLDGPGDVATARFDTAGFDTAGFDSAGFDSGGFDSGGFDSAGFDTAGFDTADAWYCILEGTAEVAVAEAQARAVVDLLASYVTPARQVLLAVDEFSAVARRLPIWQLYERARSLGLAVQVSAQSWHGLAEREDDRYRLAGTAEGGIWLLRTPHPEPVVALAGEQLAVDSTWQLAGIVLPRWRRRGTSRLRDSPVADPNLIRGLDTGQAAYLYRGGVTFTQVKRLTATPPALIAAQPGPAQAGPAQPGPAQPGPAQPAETAAPRPADVSALLAEAFGPDLGGRP